MSYINFSFTERSSAGAIPSTQTIRMGFSREGGRLEHVDVVRSNRGPLPPRTHAIALDTPGVAEAAGPVLQALQGAGWVQDVLVEQGHGRVPGTVTWSLRHGGGGSAPTNDLPEPISAVVDAARALRSVLDGALAVRPLPVAG